MRSWDWDVHRAHFHDRVRSQISAGHLPMGPKAECFRKLHSEDHSETFQVQWSAGSNAALSLSWAGGGRCQGTSSESKLQSKVVYSTVQYSIPFHTFSIFCLQFMSSCLFHPSYQHQFHYRLINSYQNSMPLMSLNITHLRSLCIRKVFEGLACWSSSQSQTIGTLDGLTMITRCT